MKQKTTAPRKKAVRDTSKYELIFHLAKVQRVKPEQILTMTPQALAGYVDDDCRDTVIRYLNKNRKRMAKHDLAFPGLNGQMSKLALVTGIDKFLAKRKLTRADIFWPMRSKNYTRRNIVQTNADSLEVKTALENLQALVPPAKAKKAKRTSKKA